MEYKILQTPGLAIVELIGDVGMTIGDVLRAIRKQLEPSPIAFDCSLIRRINSVGIANWSAALQNEFQGFSYRYIKCTDQFIDAAVMIPRFPVNGHIESVAPSLHCESCDRDEQVVYPLNSATLRKLEIDQRCAKCGETLAQMDNLASNLETLIEREAFKPRPASNAGIVLPGTR